MSATPTIYRSTDPSAPILNGTPGAFAALLDAVLVDGYGAGEDAKAPLGWLRVFSDGHKRVFRNDDSAGATGYCIRFDDSTDRYCSVSAFETMSDVDTGTNVFAAATPWEKSIDASTSARDWVVVGNDRSVYYFVNNGSPIEARRDTAWFFGDLNTFGAMDVWGFAYSEGEAVSSFYTSGLFVTNGASMRAARKYDGSAVGATLRNRLSMIESQSSFGASGSLPYPYPTTNGAVLSQVILTDGGYLRATLPGILISEHNQNFDGNVVYSGFPDLPPGTELLCMLGTRAQVFPKARGLVDLSNPWY